MDISQGPPPKNLSGRPVIYPFEDLKKKDDFFAWKLKKGENPVARRSAILICAKKRGFKITTRLMDRKIYVWRVFD
jgi:hypothetical protein